LEISRGAASASPGADRGARSHRSPASVASRAPKPPSSRPVARRT